MHSPDDPEATFRRKANDDFHGYVVHTTETADPENGLPLITDVVVEANNRDGSRILHERLEPMMRKTPDLQELHTDGAYGSVENNRLQAELGITAVQSGMRGRHARAPMRIEALEAGGYQITCAAGHRTTSQPTRLRYKAEFPAAGCAQCPFASVCPAALRKEDRTTFYFTHAQAPQQARHHRLSELD